MQGLPAPHSFRLLRLLLFIRLVPTCSLTSLFLLVEIFSANWGPCEMVAGHFSNYFFDLGETKGIKFVRATSDKIAALDAYRGKSDSNFLFYLNGEQIHAIAGSFFLFSLANGFLAYSMWGDRGAALRQTMRDSLQAKGKAP